jgi:hypothetical protein
MIRLSGLNEHVRERWPRAKVGNCGALSAWKACLLRWGRCGRIAVHSVSRTSGSCFSQVTGALHMHPLPLSAPGEPARLGQTLAPFRQR